MEPEIVLSEPRQPALPMHRSASNHLGYGAEKIDLGFFVCRRPQRAWVKDGVGPEIVAINIGQLVATEAFSFAPWSAL
jgi:hypothetical protein